VRACLILPLLLFAGCAGGDGQAGGNAADRAASARNEAQRPSYGSPAPPREAPPPASRNDTGFAPPRVPADSVLSRMLAAVAPFQEHQQPCIAKEPLRGDFSPEQRRRGKIIWSDSIELQNRIRAAYGDRILLMSPDVSAGADKARFVVRVTGHASLPAYRLGGRARDVPVVVEYGMPYSAEQLREKARAATPELMRLLPDAQGWSVSEGYGFGALSIHVYSPTGRPPANLTSLCEQLIRAAGMPVLLTYGTGRLTNDLRPSAR
jgi:hypothetical protein